MSDRQIKEAIEQLSGGQLADQVYVIPCKVLEVDRDNYTCTCEAIGGTAVTDIPNVRLMAVIDDGVLLIPAIDSVVQVTYTKREQPYISLYSELQALNITIGNSEIEITPGLIKMNDGTFGGLVKVAELTKKLNNVEKLLNDLILKYNVHVHTANNTPTIAQETGVIVPTLKPEIENPIITHGK